MSVHLPVTLQSMTVLSLFSSKYCPLSHFFLLPFICWKKHIICPVEFLIWGLNELICAWWLEYIRYPINIHCFLLFYLSITSFLPSENTSFCSKKKVSKVPDCFIFSVPHWFAATHGALPSLCLLGPPHLLDPQEGPLAPGRWRNKGVWGRNQSQRGSVEMARVESGPETRISPFPGADDGDTRREAQRKLEEGVKSCRNPKRGWKQHLYH